MSRGCHNQLDQEPGLLGPTGGGTGRTKHFPYMTVAADPPRFRSARSRTDGARPALRRGEARPEIPRHREAPEADGATTGFDRARPRPWPAFLAPCVSVEPSRWQGAREALAPVEARQVVRPRSNREGPPNADRTGQAFMTEPGIPASEVPSCHPRPCARSAARRRAAPRTCANPRRSSVSSSAKGRSRSSRSRRRSKTLFWRVRDPTAASDVAPRSRGAFPPRPLGLQEDVRPAPRSARGKRSRRRSPPPARSDRFPSRRARGLVPIFDAAFPSEARATPLETPALIG